MLAGRLHHVSFPVGDLDRSMDFYGRVLGLKPIDRPSFPFPGAWYQAGQCEVHLIVAYEGSDIGRAPRSLNPLAAHVAFAIDDYERMRERLESEGVAVLAAGASVGQMWVQDPDGNTLELITQGR
jgi:catechol 2,3-dioxygenase-like lactoylglutathione lyase family enzyme